MDKGDVQHAFIIAVLIIIMTLFVLLIILSMTGLILADDFDMRTCQLTLTLQANSQIGLGGATSFDSPFAIKCPRRYIEIDEKGAITKFQDRKLVSKPVLLYTPDTTDPLTLKPTLFKTWNDSAIQNVLAESMHRCWQIGGQGQEAIFNDESYATNKNICLICDQIDVNLPAGVEYDSGAGGQATLSTYLKQHNAPLTKPIKTYDDYLFTPTSLQRSFFERSIFTTHGVSIGDMMNGDTTLSGGKLCLGYGNINEDPVITRGTYATVLFRYFAKRDYGCMNTYVVPADKLKSLCDYIAN